MTESRSSKPRFVPIRHASGVLVSFSALVLMVMGCDASDGSRGSVTRTPRDIEGVYRVEGTTLETATGVSREISGLLVVRQDGDRYTSNFDLASSYSTEGGDTRNDVSIEIIGEGSGRIDGNTLLGTAETQVVRSMIPGVHVRFALMPRSIGPRVVAQTKATVERDRTIVFEIQSKPGEGESYAATRAKLVGRRVGDVGRAPDLPDLPDVAAPPPDAPE